MKPKAFFRPKYMLLLGALIGVIALITFRTDIISGIGAFYGVKNLNSAQVSERLDGNEFLILDVREREEFEVSHLKGAVLASEVDLEILRTDQPILVYCTVGYRSTELGATLTKKGFSDIYNLEGGLIRWKNEGFKVYNIHEQPTDSIHVYSDIFGLLLTDGQAVK